MIGARRGRAGRRSDLPALARAANLPRESGKPTRQAGVETAEGCVLSERGDGAGHGREGGAMRSVLGVDVGGTFTDFVVYDPRTKQVEVWKELSTPGDPVTGILSGLAAYEERERLENLRVGTTV